MARANTCAARRYSPAATSFQPVCAHDKVILRRLADASSVRLSNGPAGPDGSAGRTWGGVGSNDSSGGWARDGTGADGSADWTTGCRPAFTSPQVPATPATTSPTPAMSNAGMVFDVLRRTFVTGSPSRCASCLVSRSAGPIAEKSERGDRQAGLDDGTSTRRSNGYWVQDGLVPCRVSGPPGGEARSTYFIRSA